MWFEMKIPDSDIMLWVGHGKHLLGMSQVRLQTQLAYLWLVRLVDCVTVLTGVVIILFKYEWNLQI